MAKPYRSSSIIDVVTAARHIVQFDFMRAIAHAALEWSFRARSPLVRTSIHELMGEGVEVRLRGAEHTWGETPPTDLLALSALVAATRPRRVFEFGTFTGNGTLHLALNARDDAEIFTFDLDEESRDLTRSQLGWEGEVAQDTIGAVFRDTPEARKIMQLFGDSRAFDPTGFDTSMDFIYIDAAHHYDFVASDTENAFAMCRQGAVVAWHDYSRACPGVVRCVDEVARRREVRLIDGTSIAFCRVA